jgi:hypothetical protein
MSPSFTSVKLAMPMPHSMPLVTSRRIVLEALERSDLALEDLLRRRASRAPPRRGGSRHRCTRQPAMVPTLGILKTLMHLGAARVVLLEGRFEQSVHGQANLVLQLVDDRVQADLHVLLLRQLGALRSGRTLKPMMMAFDAVASSTSLSVMAPTPECSTLTRTFSVDMRQRVGQHFHRSLSRRP